MTKRRVILLSLAGLVLIAGAAFAWWALAADPLEGLAEQVHSQMTEAEVKALLGEPTFSSKRNDNGTVSHRWMTDRIIIFVLFDKNDRVTNKLVDRRPLWDR